MEIEQVNTRVTWLLAGVPILVTFVQTLTALVGTKTASTPVLGGVARAVHDVAVFRQASLLFWQSSTIIAVLFALITVGWAAQGVTMFATRNRDVTFAAAGLVSILFFALFWGIYAPLLGSVPALQSAVFFSTPVFAAGLVGASAWFHDWDTDIHERASTTLAETESALESARSDYEDEFEARVGSLSTYEDVAPNGCERARERREEFLDRCGELRAELESLRATSEDATSFDRRATELREQVSALDPVGAVDGAEASLRQSVSSGVRVEYGDVSVPTDDGGAFTLVNLSTEYREVSIPALDESVHLGRVDSALLEALGDGTPLPTVADAIEQVDRHLDRLESHLEERSTAFATERAAVESSLETAENSLDRLDSPLGDRVAEFVREGRNENLAGVPEVRDACRRAGAAFRDCQFEDANRLLEEAGADAESLVSLAEFAQAVESSVEFDSRSISIPNRVEPDVVADLVPAVERAFGVSAGVAGGELRIDYDGAVDVDGGDADRDADPMRPESSADDASSSAPPTSGLTSRSDTDSGDGVASQGGASSPGGDATASLRPEDALDAVLYVFRELESAAPSTAGESAQLQTDRLPASVAAPGVLSLVEQFTGRQTDIVEDVSVPESGPPGYVELQPASSKSGREVARTLHERYQDRYADGR